ncbi:MAG: protein kinase [Polyangiaceae bacterium]|nr:protein kinase [Polyangiaceae bacterium]
MANLPTVPGAKRDDKSSRFVAADDDRISANDDPMADDLPRPLGRYMLLKRIARGGMGEVMLATTMGIEGAERPVIVKIIRREHKKDPNFYARFLDETRVQAQLSHSGVAQMLDAAIDDATGEPYAVVEHVEGKSLGELRQRAVQTGHRLAWADAVALAQLIAEGLAHVHERKDPSGRPLAIVHRDLSPQNVMVSFTGEVKIIDFGTARGQNRRCHTVSGVVFAKPGYVAPEVANGDSGDARVDLYALGIMLWELCAGRRFLQGDAQVHLAKVARNEMSPPKLAEQLKAPEALDVAIAKLTAFERDERYLAARAAATDLAKLLASAPALPSGERGVRPRAAHLMSVLFPGEPNASRKELARLIAAARVHKPSEAKPAANNKRPEPAPKAAEKATPATEQQPSFEGTKYRIVREIGRGATSTVFEMEHIETKKHVAVKLLSGESASKPESVERFRRAARALSVIEHPGLACVHEIGTLADGRPFCVMDLLEGETLKDYLARERGADYRETLTIASSLLKALEVAHSAGIVHRDIQPSNVFLTPGGGVKLLDFGLAGGRAIALETPGSQAPAREITIFGTPEYMAPEQVLGGDVDGRADLYAVGCIAFEMLTGRLPFEGKSALAILDQKRKGSPPKPQEIAPARAIPETVSDVLMKALSRQPSARFQSATEMIRAIENALGSSRKRSSSRRILGGLAAVTALLAIALGIGFVKSEKFRSRMPARVVALFSKPVSITPEPVVQPEPARSTDLAEVPLGEVPLENPPPAAAPNEPAENSNDALAADESDPALADGGENADVVAGVDPEDMGEAAPAALNETQAAPAAPPAKPVKATPKPRRHVKPAAKKSAPKQGETAPTPTPAKSNKSDQTKNDNAKPNKHLAPLKDDDEAARKKKKKVRLAKAR